MDKVILHNGGSTSLVGHEAVEIMRLAAIIGAVKLEAKGLRVRRGFSATKLAKKLTGLRTNDRTKLVTRLEIMLENQKRQVMYVDERKGAES